MTVADRIVLIVFIVWAALSVASLFLFRVFSAAKLRSAPTRRGMVSLAFVGLVLLLYFGGAVFAVTLARSAGIAMPERPSEAASGTAAPASAGTGSNAAQAAVNEQLANIAAELVAVGLFLVLVPRLFVDGYRGFGMGGRDVPVGVLWGLLGFACIYPMLTGANDLSVYIARLQQHEIPPHPIIQDLRQFTTTPVQKGLLVLVAGVLAPLCEEIFFRGIIQNSLIQQGWGFIVGREQFNPRSTPAAYQRWAAIVLTAAAFALVHQADTWLVIFTLGVALGYIYERTGNLWAPITLHAAFNMLSLVQVIYLGG